MRGALGLALVVLLAGCSPTSLSRGNARKGSLLFVQYRCLSCHAVNGMGGTSAPNLTHDIASVDVDLLRYFIEHPPSQMAYLKTMHISDTDIHNLSAFTDSDLVAQGSAQAPTSTSSSSGGSSGNRGSTSSGGTGKKGSARKKGSTRKKSGSAVTAAQAGAKLFVTDKCVDCHQVNGSGGTSAPDLTDNPTATNYSLLQAELDTPPPAMSYVTGLHLTSTQILDLSKFAASNLKPAR